MIINILILFAGLVVLVLGGDFLIKGSSSLALKMNLSPLVVGLTIVAFGTSAPELIVNIIAAISDVKISNTYMVMTRFCRPSEIVW